MPENILEAFKSLGLPREDLGILAAVVDALDRSYGLSGKITQEPGLKEIILQLFSRLIRSYKSLAAVSGQRILDIACGSNTSRAPESVLVRSLFGERQIQVPHPEGYSAQFEPWFCRILLELHAEPVGVDRGDLKGERFEYHNLDLGEPGALNIFPAESFDAVQDSRLFGSPEFVAQFPDPADRVRIAEEIWGQEQRLLKPGGLVIHSDAARLLNKNPTKKRDDHD